MFAFIKGPLMWAGNDACPWSPVSTTMVEKPTACLRSVTLRTSVRGMMAALPPGSLGQISRWVVRMRGLTEVPQSFAVRATNSSSPRRPPSGSGRSSVAMGNGNFPRWWANSVRRRASRSDVTAILGHLLHLSGAQRGGGHPVEIAVDRRFDCSDHGAFDKGRVAEQHATASVGELLHRHLRAEHGAAEVDQDQHALRSADLLDRGQDGGGIGSKPSVRGAAGDGDLH